MTDEVARLRKERDAAIAAANAWKRAAKFWRAAMMERPENATKSPAFVYRAARYWRTLIQDSKSTVAKLRQAGWPI